MKSVAKGLLLLVVIVLIAFFAMPGVFIKNTVEVVGSRVMGVPVTLNGVSVSWLKGAIRLDGLTVGNPAGFKKPTAVEIDHFSAAVNPASLLSDTIQVSHITVDGLKLTYEGDLKNSNLQALMNNMPASTPAAAEPATAQKPAASSKPGKKVVIDHIDITGPKVQLALNMAGLASAGGTLSLPDVHMKDIGKDSGGTSVSDAVHKVLATLMQSATKAITGGGKMLKDMGTQMGENLGHKAGGMLKGIFGK